MKITLYWPDGGVEPYTDCRVEIKPGAFGFEFIGTDFFGKRRHLTTTLPYTIETEVMQ